VAGAAATIAIETIAAILPLRRVLPRFVCESRHLVNQPTSNDCFRSAFELLPAYTSIVPGSTTNDPRLS
jgi:hypothetical protein